MSGPFAMLLMQHALGSNPGAVRGDREQTRAYEAQLAAQVVESLAMHLMDNARFMAERLYAEFPTEDNACLLGTCYYWCDKAYAAYDLLRGCGSANARYVLALCCIKLSKYHEASKALQDGDEVPNGCYGHFLLGKVAKLCNRHEMAVVHFQHALTMNPMLWSAYEELCALGACDVATRILNDEAAVSQPIEPVLPLDLVRPSGSEGQQQQGGASAAAALFPMACRAAVSSGCGMATDSSHETHADQQATDDAVAAAPPGPDPEAAGTSGGGGDGGVKRRASGPSDDGTAPGLTAEARLAGQAATVHLLRGLGEGHRLLVQYRAQEAIEAFRNLPAQHYQTSWVLTEVGRAHFERSDYSQAVYAFKWSHNQDPNRLEGLEWYSTLLWHTKNEVDLSHLAQETLALDRLAPQTWCVMGNCFSLQKEHETAIRFFKRALQLDPNFTYAYTLCGHEYLINEDFDKALAFFRNAIARDANHVNAWFGIGHIYYKQEKYEMAIQNFTHALSIHRTSAVLQCYLGMALQRLGRSTEALTALEEATRLDAKNPLARSEGASVLASLERYDEAIAEYERLKDIIPRDPDIYFQMGRIYKKLKQPDAALTHFCHAMDLRPSTSEQNQIKSAIEKLHVDDDDVEDEI